MVYKNKVVNNLLDVIVLCHNSLFITKKFLIDLYKNTKDFSLFLIDNGSTDKTPEYLKNFANEKNNVTLFLSDKNLGVISGRNFGYKLSCDYNNLSEYVFIIDNDQFVQDGWLESHMAVIKEGYDLVGVEGWKLNKQFFPIGKLENPLEPYDYVGCGGSLIKRSVIEDIGLFDERFNPCYFEDPDLSFKMYDKGYKFTWNHKSKILHLPHQTLGKLSDKKEKFLSSYKKFQEKWEGHKLPNIVRRTFS